MGTKHSIKENTFHHHQRSVFEVFSKCSRCGKEPHSQQQCPAKDTICHRCNKKGHYGAQCFKNNKRVADITMEDSTDMAMEDQDFAYLNTLDSLSENFLPLSISINGQQINGQVDTGAEVTAITLSTYNLLSSSVTLEKPAKSLRGPDKKPLTTMGMAQVRLPFPTKTRVPGNLSMFQQPGTKPIRTSCNPSPQHHVIPSGSHYIKGRRHLSLPQSIQWPRHTAG